MQSLFDLIKQIDVSLWHYYFGISPEIKVEKPFIDNSDYTGFIKNFFKKGGKYEVFKQCKIRPKDLRFPNHICSVFFLGILLYNKTSFKQRYDLGSNDPDYKSFPFIWFLIALFHDNAYYYEDKTKLINISSLDDLIKEFDIDYSLFERKFSQCKPLLESRENYFLFKKKKYQVVDHGILAGLLLFDKLVKIREEKKKIHEEDRFWGAKLESQYETAANAISIHNIWLQSEGTCKEFQLQHLLDFKPVKFDDFPLFYILGIVDTIEPLKAFQESNHTDEYILKNLCFEFESNSLKVSNHPDSKLKFKEILKRIVDLIDWLDVDVAINNNSFELKFR